MNSILDYRNFLSIDIKQSLVGLLQLDLNAAAYLLLSNKRYNNVLTVSADFHWLHVLFRTSVLQCNHLFNQTARVVSPVESSEIIHPGTFSVTQAEIEALSRLGFCSTSSYNLEQSATRYLFCRVSTVFLILNAHFLCWF